MDPSFELRANDLLTTLLDGKVFAVPVVDLSSEEYQAPEKTGPLYDPVERIKTEDLTTKIVGGSGVFDVLMSALDAHLRKEFEAGRIAGAEYTKAYVALVESVLQASVQFLLGRDQANWQAITAQFQAQIAHTQTTTARIELETAKAALQAKSYEALANEATYGLTKAKLSTEEVGYETAVFNLENILSEQYEGLRAQTLDTRTDGTPVAGVIGKQKALYEQQITSYKRDAETKATKLFTDAWITQKTIDEGLLPPDAFNNASLNDILETIKANNDLGS